MVSEFIVNTTIKIFERIDASFIGRFVARRHAIIEATNPNQIKVEQVAAFFYMPKWMAKLLCEMAVCDGAFKKNKNSTYKLTKQGKK